MTSEQLSPNTKVANKKYGSEELVLMTNVLMKDKSRGWIQSVLYVGPDRNSPTKDLKVYCKAEEDFLKEFDLM